MGDKVVVGVDIGVDIEKRTKIANIRRRKRIWLLLLLRGWRRKQGWWLLSLFLEGAKERDLAPVFLMLLAKAGDLAYIFFMLKF